MSKPMFLFISLLASTVWQLSEQSRHAREKEMKEQDVAKQIKALGGVVGFGLKGEEDGVRFVSLKNASVTDGDIINLNWAAFPSLFKVDLSSTKVTDAVASKLATIKRLRILYLANTNISDVSLKSLQPLSQQMEKLDLSHTSVTDSGMEVIKTFKNLKYINLSGTVVTKVGLAQVLEIATIEHIQSSISPSELEIFSKKYPNVKFDK